MPKGIYPRPSMVERFWSKVDKSGDCWLWPVESLDRDGYGSFHTAPETRCRAHRVAYELTVGPIPEGLVLDHLCRNRRCVKPTHLEPVDSRTNTLRGEGAPAILAAAEACVNGHAFTPENTYRYGRRRMCKACIFRRQRERRQRLKQEAARG